MRKNQFRQTGCGLALTFAVILAVISQAPPVFAFGMADVRAVSSDVSGAARAWMSEGYQTAPALMLGLAVFAAIPLMAFGARINARVLRDRAATRRYRASLHRDASGKIPGEGIEHPPFAFLEVVGPSGQRFAISRDMLRIGREDDNDVRIPSNAIHRYHAAIYRQSFDDWHIADLSGTGGNGIAVNGQRCLDARLHDGDVIDLGPGKLRFRAMAA